MIAFVSESTHLVHFGITFMIICSGASSSMIEDRSSKITEKILNQLHKGNFNPCIKSEPPTPEVPNQAHPLEMSCIPFIASPSQQMRGRLGTVSSDNVFLDTPELVCASKTNSCCLF